MSSRELTRTPEPRLLAGVGSKVAAHLGASACHVRLAFLVLAVVEPMSAVLIYAALALFLPDPPQGFTRQTSRRDGIAGFAGSACAIGRAGVRLLAASAIVGLAIARAAFVAARAGLKVGGAAFRVVGTPQLRRRQASAKSLPTAESEPEGPAAGRAVTAAVPAAEAVRPTAPAARHGAERPAPAPASRESSSEPPRSPTTTAKATKPAPALVSDEERLEQALRGKLERQAARERTLLAQDDTAKVSAPNRKRGRRRRRLMGAALVAGGTWWLLTAAEPAVAQQVEGIGAQVWERASHLLQQPLSLPVLLVALGVWFVLSSLRRR